MALNIGACFHNPFPNVIQYVKSISRTPNVEYVIDNFEYFRDHFGYFIS